MRRTKIADIFSCPFFEILFPTLTVGLLDFKVCVVLTLRPEPDCRAQSRSDPAVPDHQASLQYPTTKYPCSAQPQSIPSAPNHQVFLQCPSRVSLQCLLQSHAVSNHQVCLRCLTAKYPAVRNRRASMQYPIAEYPCSTQPTSIPAVHNRRISLHSAVPNRRTFLQRLTATADYSCNAHNSRAPLQCATPLSPHNLQYSRPLILRETSYFLRNSGFRKGGRSKSTMIILFRYFPLYPIIVAIY